MKNLYVVNYVGLSENEYDANGYTNNKVCSTLDAAKAKMKEWRNQEIEHLKNEGNDYEILEDEDDECRISWCGGSEQLRLSVNKVEIEPNTTISDDNDESTDDVMYCPYCGSENIEWMSDAFGTMGDTETYHCHECDSWFGVK